MDDLIAYLATLAVNHCFAAIQWVAARKPTIEFLTDAIAVEATILGLTIPLSFEIISRVSERYESDTVTQEFIDEPVVRLMPYCLAINITLAITMKFLSTPNHEISVKWKLCAWLGFVGFIVTALMLFGFLNTLKKYVVDREYVLAKLFQKAKNALK